MRAAYKSRWGRASGHKVTVRIQREPWAPYFAQSHHWTHRDDGHDCSPLDWAIRLRHRERHDLRAADEVVWGVQPSRRHSVSAARDSALPSRASLRAWWATMWQWQANPARARYLLCAYLAAPTA